LVDAVLVNPYSAEEMSDAIVTALKMERQERISRWRSMMASIRSKDVIWWRKTFTDELMAA